MKIYLTVISSALKNRILSITAMVCLFMVPIWVFGQNPPDNPDEFRPQDVPLDPKMSLLLIVMGFLFAVRILKKQESLLQSARIGEQ
jgi:hypothetical protein